MAKKLLLKISILPSCWLFLCLWLISRFQHTHTHTQARDFLISTLELSTLQKKFVIVCRLLTNAQNIFGSKIFKETAFRGEKLVIFILFLLPETKINFFISTFKIVRINDWLLFFSNLTFNSLIYSLWGNRNRQHYYYYYCIIIE